VFINRTDGNYASDVVLMSVGTGDGSTTTFTATLPNTPVRPGTAVVRVDNDLAAQDNGTGGWTSDALTSASTIAYDTGAISLTWSTAPSSTAAIVVEYRWDVEYSPDDLREMEIGLNLVPVSGWKH